RPPDLSFYIAEWAEKYGLTPTEGLKLVKQWAKEVEARRPDSYRLGLAAVAAGNYKKAAEYFHDAAEQNSHRLWAIEKEKGELQQEMLHRQERSVEASRREGDSFYYARQLQ